MAGPVPDFLTNEPSSHGDLTDRLNTAIGELRQARRPWSAGFDGDYCFHNGVDYNYSGSSARTLEPGTASGAAAWVAQDYSAPSSGAPTGALIVARGDWAAFLQVASNVDIFILEQQDIDVNSAGEAEDLNGWYFRTWVNSTKSYHFLRFGQ